MKSIPILFLFLLLKFNSQAQEVLRVLDIQSGNPIPNLYVYCDLASASSNAKGEIQLNKIEKCKALKFQHPSYLDLTVSMEQIIANGFKVYLEGKFMQLGAIDLSFTKWERNKDETPIHISRISKKEIEFQNPQTTADLLEQSGQVFVQKSQLGGGSPMIRGFSTSRVLLVVDGVRMNTAIFREGNVQNVISLDANAIEQTDIIFGPGAVIYGSDAIGGVMNFSTLSTPQFSFSQKTKFSLNYLARYNSANSEKTSHVDFGFSKSKFASITSISFSDYGDQLMGSFGPEEYLRNHYQSRINGKDSTFKNSNPQQQIGTGFHQLNLMQKFKFRVNSNSDLSYGIHYSISSDLPRYDRLIEYSGVDTLKNAQWYYGPQQWMMHNLNYDLRLNKRFFDNLKISLAYQFFEESRNDRKMFNDNLRQRTEQVNAINSSLDFEKTIDPKTRIHYGFDNVFNEISSTGIIKDINSNLEEPTSTRYPDGSFWNSSSAYASLTRRILPELTFDAGVRFNLVLLRGEVDTGYFPLPDGSIDNNFKAINGSLGLAYLPNKKWKFNLNASNGFRAPNIDDISKIFDSSPGNVVIPNPDLKPEFLYALDLGASNNSWEPLKIQLNLYLSYLQNALSREDYNLNGQDSIIYDGSLSQVQAVQNIGSARVWGIQASADLRIIKDLHILGSINYTKGETTDGDPLRHVSPIFGNTHLTYKYKLVDFDFYGNFNGALNYDQLAESERDKPLLYADDENGNPYSPSWYTLNFRMSFQLSQKLKLQVGLQNINDARYRTYSSGIAAMGQSINLAVRGNL